MTNHDNITAATSVSSSRAHYTHEALESCVANADLYAIIDPVAHDDIAGFAAELAESGHSSPVPDTAISEYLSEDCVPHLLRISPRFWRFLNRDVWSKGEGESAPSWGIFFELHNPKLPFETLLSHWRDWYMVDLPNNRGDGTAGKSLPAVFRFFDPRLLDAFLKAANRAEARAFFGPVSRFLLPQADGSARVCAAPQPSSDSVGSESIDISPEQPFKMQHQHLNALELRRLEHRIPAFQAYLEKHFDEDFQRWQIDDRDTFIRAGLRRAIEQGFFSERAAAGWLSMQLLHGPNFAKEQRWAMEILKDTRHTVGSEDRADRLISAGFDKIRQQENMEAHS